MNDTLHHLCHTNDNGELELISSHATREEAWEDWKAQHPTTKFIRIMCVADLKGQVRYSTYQQDGIRNRISRKRQQYKEYQRERALLRRLLGELPEEAYLPLTAKFIELTDFIENCERYIKNGFLRIKRLRCWIDNNKQDLALLQAALSLEVAANKEAMDIMEKRSLAHTHSIRGDDNPREMQDSE